MRHERIIAIVGSTRSLQRLESGGASGLTYPVIGALCDLYKVPADEKFELQRLWELKDATTWTQPRRASVFRYSAYRELQLSASLIRKYETTFVPGHFQTERYMRDMFSRNPDLDEERIEIETESRLRAQEPFWEDDPNRRYRFLLSEAVLRYGCDAKQIERIIEADSLKYTTVKYIPYESGPPPLLYVSFSLLSFPDDQDPDIVWVEAPDTYLYFEKEDSVHYYRMGFESTDDLARSVKEFKL